MKLEIESQSASLPMVDPKHLDEAINDSSTPEVDGLLRDGIKAAQDGERAEARNLLLRVTDEDPENEQAWLWLASISEFPEELLVFLNNVLRINPKNERATEWSAATKSLIAKGFVNRGVEACENEQNDYAKQCFLQAIVHDDQNESAWLWLATVTDSEEERSSYLHKVLRINPENESASATLDAARDKAVKSKLMDANRLAIGGEHEAAQELLSDILDAAPDMEDAWMLRAHLSESFEGKIECFEKVLELNPENLVARANLDSLKMFVSRAPAKAPEADSAAVPENKTEFYSADDREAMGIPEADAESDAEEVVSSLEADAESDAEEAVSSMDSEDTPEMMVDQAPQAVDWFEDEEDFVVEESVDFEEVDRETVQPEAEDLISLESPDEVPESQEDLQAESEFPEEELLEAVAPVYQESETAEEMLVFGEESEMRAEEGAVEELHFDAIDQPMSFDGLGAPEEVSEEDSDEVSEEPDFVPVESDSVFAEEDPETGFRSKCQFCGNDNETRAFVCGQCGVVLSLSDLELLLSNDNSDRDVVMEAIQRIEAEQNERGVVEDELMTLGIGYINLKEFRKGFEYLQEYSVKHATDVMLQSQLDALAVRVAEIEDKERGRESQPKAKTILVVDDSPTIRKLISLKLQKCGHETICAVDGVDALEKINESIPDLVLLDITMPRMDGYQVCKLIRGNDTTKDVPVVMISGKDGFFDKVRGKMAGTTNYITKPFGPETLMRTVNEYLA